MPKRARSPGALSRQRSRAREEDVAAQGAAGTSSTITPSRPSKRHKSKPPILSLEGSLSEEILLRCLSFLPVTDLLAVNLVSSAWNRLAKDPQLWRALYLSTFATSSPSRSLSSLHTTRTRPWRELYKISSNWRRGNVRPSRSLRQAVLAEAPEDLSIAGEAAPQRVEEEEVTTARQEPTRPTDTILQFHRHWFFTASRTPVAGGTLPSVTVHQTLPSGDSLLLGSITSPALQGYLDSRPTFRPSLSITDLQLDLSTSESFTSVLHLAVFYSTGQYSLFHLSLPTLTSPFNYTEAHTHLALSTTGPMSSTFDPVVLARFHSPLLVTCSRAFVLRFWRVEGSKVEEVEPSLRSRESWAPVVLTLKRETRVVEEEEDEEDEWGMRRLMGESVGKELPEREEEVFRVTLAYSTPVFPEGWSVGVQEFVVRIPPTGDPSPSASSLDRAFHRARVSITARHAIAPPTTSFHLSPSPHRRHQSSLVTSLEYSTPYLVASKADNTLDVFQLVSSPPPPPARLPSAHQHLHLRTDLTPQEGKLHLVHRRTLFGHTSRVTSVAVEDGGRCVSGGDDGVVKVWQLAGDEGRERAVDVVEEGVEAARERSVWEVMKERRGVKSRVGSGERREGGTKRIKRVYFDEDKIVSIVAGAGPGGEEVRVLRFD